MTLLSHVCKKDASSNNEYHTAKIQTVQTANLDLMTFLSYLAFQLPLSPRQHLSYGDCLEVKREYYQNCSVLDCVIQCSQSAAHLYEQFLQVKQIGFVTMGPLRRRA